MKIFLFAASLRKDSYNKKLIRIAADIVKTQPGCFVELSEFNDFPMPMYDGDLEASQGIPEGVLKLAQKINTADAVIIASPEYNGSIPGTFKNAIDWLSRINPVPLAKKQVCLIGASPGNFAAVRGNIHARVPFHVLGTYLYPDYFGLARAHEAFDDKGQFKDVKQTERLTALLSEFLRYASRRETPAQELAEFT